jgi:hypothetical protein
VSHFCVIFHVCPESCPDPTLATSEWLHLRPTLRFLVSKPAVIMIRAILPLLLAQWHSATNAQSSAQSQLCYYSANNLLESVFLPCGDPQNGFKTCCEAGDNCLANSACYSPRCKYSSYSVFPVSSLKISQSRDHISSWLYGPRLQRQQLSRKT